MLRSLAGTKVPSTIYTASSRFRRSGERAGSGARWSRIRSAADFEIPNSGPTCRNVRLVRQYVTTNNTRSASGKRHGLPRWMPPPRRSTSVTSRLNCAGLNPTNGSIHFGSSAEITPPMTMQHLNSHTGYGTTFRRECPVGRCVVAFGAWATIYGRFRQWRDAGAFQALMEALIADPARAARRLVRRRCDARLKAAALGRSRSGLTGQLEQGGPPRRVTPHLRRRPLPGPQHGRVPDQPTQSVARYRHALRQDPRQLPRSTPPQRRDHLAP